MRLLDIGFEFLFILMLLSAALGCSDSCDDATCYNGGICVDGVCFCPEGWTGADCSTSCEPVEFNGYTYDVVVIGDQCWFTENLRSDHYRNGDTIPGDLSDSEWAETNSGAQAIYENSNNMLYGFGRLYNWYAVDDARGLCPTGWHVPSDGEWTELMDYLGGDSLACEPMKSSSSDTPSWNGSNSSGFSGLPGGNRYYDGLFGTASVFGYWWSSSPSSSDAWFRVLSYSDDFFGSYSYDRRGGFSVRCIRD